MSRPPKYRPPNAIPTPTSCGVPCHCPLPQPGLEGREILDEVGLHKGGSHPRAGRTCGLCSQVTTCQPPTTLLACHSWAGPEGCADNLPPGPGTQTRKGHRPPGNLVAGHKQDNTQQSQLRPGPALPSRPGNWLLRRPALTPGPAGVPGEGRRM